MKSLDSTRLAGIILALGLALVLSACSALKLGYTNLPNLAYWWLDGYVDFSDEQAPLVRDEIARFYAWHRQQELPKVVELLARMEQMAPADFTPQQACTVFGEVRARLDAVATEASPRIAAIAATLTGRELRYLQRKFRRNNETYREEWLDVPAAKVHEKRYERLLERLETFYGRLDEPQRVVLRQRIVQSAFDPARSHAEWQRRQQDLQQVLRRVAHRGTPEAEAPALVRGWFARVERAPDPAYRAYQDTLLHEGCATFAAVHQGTTPAQREQAARRLRDYQRDLRDLVTQP
ncbi:MAG: hypothetical protein EOO30_20455 [Comamonadaceae bacterium]|nr:MAG: hypothetical protein EOO30_20455 [Comamonadaceae bacterium]